MKINWPFMRVTSEDYSTPTWWSCPKRAILRAHLPAAILAVSDAPEVFFGDGSWEKSKDPRVAGDCGARRWIFFFMLIF